MAEKTGIAWTDHTFNPWWGCTKVSPGCKNCYAERESGRFEADHKSPWWGESAPRRFFGDKHWDEPLKWNKKAEKAGIRARVFCGSMCDIFEDRPDLLLVTERIRLWKLIENTPWLDWLLLTKRPMEPVWALPANWWCEYPESQWPKNVRLGVTAENQELFDKRVRYIRGIPNFVSIEPMLGPIDMSKNISAIDWVIVGGESGPGARPIHPEWVREIRDQCVANNVPFFFKSWGEWLPAGIAVGIPGYEYQGIELLHIFPDSTATARVGVRKAGATLDDVIWQQFPKYNKE